MEFKSKSSTNTKSSTTTTKSSSTKSAKDWNCRSCGQRRASSWCVNKHCEEYNGPLGSCGVKGCDFPTPLLLCRIHFKKGNHCKKCARAVNCEGFCTKCDVLLSCVVDGCKKHTKFINEMTIPLCVDHFGKTKICFEHNQVLIDGICPHCGMDCIVDGCDRPTIVGRPLCPHHHHAGRHCLCGLELILTEATPFCYECDMHYKCKTRGCKNEIVQHLFCKTCYKERNQYVYKRRDEEDQHQHEEDQDEDDQHQHDQDQEDELDEEQYNLAVDRAVDRELTYGRRH